MGGRSEERERRREGRRETGIGYKGKKTMGERVKSTLQKQVRVVTMVSGGFRGGKGGANAPPFGG